MPTTEANPSVVTRINVFKVRPENQARLVESLKATEQAAIQVPGWISASVHKSSDGTRGRELRAV